MLSLKNLNKNLFHYSLTFLLIVSAIFLIVLIKQRVKPSEERTLPISTQGKVTVTPNLALVNLTVITEGEDASSVQDKNAEKTNSVIKFLKEEGIKKEDIKTINFNLTPKYYYPSQYPRVPCPQILSKLGFTCPPNSPVIVGYRLDQTLQVKIRDFNNLGKIISQAVSRGVNQISSIQFTVEDIDEFKKQAREDAFKKAERQAEELAKLGGFKIKKVLNISEGQVYVPKPVFAQAEMLRMGESMPSSPTIEPGTQEVTVNLVVTFEIK